MDICCRCTLELPLCQQHMLLKLRKPILKYTLNKYHVHWLSYFKHLKLPISIKIPGTTWQIVYLHVNYITKFDFLFLLDLILYVPSTIFQLKRDGSSLVEPVLSWDKWVLLKDHNAVTSVRLEPAALRSRVKYSTTEPLRSLIKFDLMNYDFAKLIVAWLYFIVFLLARGCHYFVSLSRGGAGWTALKWTPVLKE